MPKSNPFATRFVKPGAVDFQFSRSGDLSSLLSKLKDGGWWGQILGPHGSGKSTLVYSLLKRLAKVSRTCVHLQLSNYQNRVTFDVAQTRCWNKDTQVIIDGFEVLPWSCKRRLRQECRSRNAGLLVTSHRRLRGIPVLFQTEASEDVTQQLVDRLTIAGDSRLSKKDVRTSYAKFNGNVRETLFDLYDLYEQRSRQQQDC